MNLDLSSFAFGSNIASGGGTPSWGTALGQSKPDYKFTYPGAEAILIGMMYCSVPLNAVSLPLGKGGRIYNASDLLECQMASLFRKVYINGTRIHYPFVMVLVKEDSESHPGRKSIKYSDKNTYEYGKERYSNKEFIRQARMALGLKEEACWFVYSFEVYGQDELHMSAVVVNEKSSITYANASERRSEWMDLIPDTIQTPILRKYNYAENDLSLQQIFYGAPGTGKSHEIKEKTKGIKVIRTTFHPDSDYSTFVGAYKPTMGDADVQVVPVVVNNGISLEQNKGTYKEKRITYKFVKQAFLKAYLSAWQSYADNPINPKPQFLIIEEINRGNCAQIFGDLFQLLDRADNGFSEYPIEADADVQQAVENAFAYEDEYKLSTTLDIEGKVVDYVSNYDSTLSEDVGEGRVLLLPPNLYIWATMNTSDQSLFPIDSAFKRRWDWVYIPIKPHDEENYRIEIGTSIYNWWGFLEKINQVIDDTTSSEDKKLGYFFVRAEDKVVKAEKFVSKVLFYLWNDVFKNYGFDNPIFSKGNNQKFAFSDFFEKDGSPNTIMVNAFLNKLDETIDKDHSFVETQLSEDNNSEQADSEA